MARLVAVDAGSGHYGGDAAVGRRRRLEEAPSPQRCPRLSTGQPPRGPGERDSIGCRSSGECSISGGWRAQRMPRARGWHPPFEGVGWERGAPGDASREVHTVCYDV